MQPVVRPPRAARAQHDGRHLSWFFDADGCLVLKGRLPPEQGALIVKALGMAMDADFAAQNNATDVSAEASNVSSNQEEPFGRHKLRNFVGLQTANRRRWRPMSQSPGWLRRPLAVEVSANYRRPAIVRAWLSVPRPPCAFPRAPLGC